MSTQLITVSGNEDLDQFLMKLNQATGHSNIPVMPQLKFDAEKGQWMESTEKRDKDEKVIYNPIGDSIEFQIITTRKMVRSSFDSEEMLYSREFQGNYVELFDRENKVVAKGFYSALKMANPELEYIQVLYVFYNNKPYRIKLSRSKLIKLFPFLSSFKQDNPARCMTIASRGDQNQKGAVTYYELNFKKGEAILDMPLIVKRVNDINQYLDYYSRMRNEGFKQGDGDEVKSFKEKEVPDYPEIDGDVEEPPFTVDDIPF